MKTKDRHSSIAGAQGLAKESFADRALPVLKGVEHRFVDLPGLRMHVAEAGSGRPLLLLHGFPQHWWEWRKVIPGLAEQFRLICPDLRGAGWTDAPRRGYTRDQLLADVVALLDTLGLDSVHLLTHDLGGLIGYQLCLRHSERVRRHLALSIPPPYFEFDPGLVLAIVQHAWFNLLVPVPLLGPRLLGGRRQRLPRWMLSGFSSAREAFTAEDVELFVGRFREPSRARAGSALYRHFIQPEVTRTMTGTYRGRRLSTPTRVLRTAGHGHPGRRPRACYGPDTSAAMARWRKRRHRCGQPLVVLGECRGLRLAAGGQPQQPAQVVGHRLEDPGGQPPLRLLVDGLPGREVVGQHPPF